MPGKSSAIELCPQPSLIFNLGQGLTTLSKPALASLWSQGSFEPGSPPPPPPPVPLPTLPSGMQTELHVFRDLILMGIL